MFESLDENRKIDIGKLRYENPKKKEAGVFDPEKEITDEEWGRVEDDLEKWRLETSHDYFSSPALAKLVCPGRFRHSPTTFDDIWSYAKQKIEQKTSEGSTIQSVADELFFGAVVFPERKDEIKRLAPFNIPVSPGRTVFGEFARLLMFLYPKEISKMSIDEADLEKLIKERNEKRDWFLLARHLSTQKIFFPHKKPSVKMTDKIWKELRAMLKSYLTANYIRDYGSNAALSLAFDMKILASKEVRVTDDGLEFIEPAELELKENIPPIPMVKKFK